MLVLVIGVVAASLLAALGPASVRRSRMTAVSPREVEQMQRRFDWTGARVVFQYHAAQGKARFIEWTLQGASGQVARISSYQGFPRVVEFSKLVRVPALRRQAPIPAPSDEPEAHAARTAISALRLIYTDGRLGDREPTVLSVTPLGSPHGASAESVPTTRSPGLRSVEVRLALPPGFIPGVSRAEVRVFPDEDAVWRILVPELGRER